MRSLMTFTILALLAAGLFSCNSSPSNSSDSSDSSKTLTREDLGWKLGTQAYTFRKFTFFQAVDKTKELGLHYIEAYPGQKIGGGLDGVMNYHIDSATRQKIKEHLKKQDVKLMAFGVVVPDTPAGWDSLFAFAKDMGISNIVSEPRPDELPHVSQLCDQYQINVAIHDHPKPSHYWSPDTLLAAIKGLSPRIGSCSDVGHWVRSGLNAVTCLKKLEGRIKELHFKDIASKTPKAEDTIWGAGVMDLPGMLQELQRQNFKGLFSIEYEADPEDNMSQIKKSIQYFDTEVGKLKKNKKEE